MQHDLIVAVFAPTTGTGAAPGRVGTGYPVTEDLILTSRHVVEPNNRNHEEPIRVRWFYDKPPGGKPPDWVPIRDADLVWVGEGDLDAALIRCRRPERLRKFSFGQLVTRRPVEGERWKSSGFARANKRDDVREPGRFGGTLREMAEAASFFEVLEDAQPIAEEQWKGVSGMPVFVGSNILGIVKHVPPNYDHKKLEAVPVWRLLADEGFTNALGLDDQHERLQAARKWLSNLLNRSKAVTRDFAEYLELSGAPKVEEVVEKLLVQTPEQLLTWAVAVQAARRDEKDGDGDRVVKALALILLPAIHDPGVVSRVRRHKGDVAEPVIALPTELRTLAEIIMAGADRREARLRPVQAEGYFPDGEPSLAPPPESGRDKDADGKQFSRDLFTDLVTVFGNDCGRFDRDFRNYLKERFIQRNQRSAAEEELRKMIEGELRYFAEDEHLTYYFIAEISADPKVSHGQEEALAQLKQDYKYIAFLRLAGGEGLATERRRYRRLCKLLYQNPEVDG